MSMDKQKTDGQVGEVSGLTTHGGTMIESVALLAFVLQPAPKCHLFNANVAQKLWGARSHQN